LRSLELSEAIVDAVNHDAPCGALRFVVGHRTARDDQRRSLYCWRLCDHIVRKRRPEEGRRRDDGIGGPEPSERDLFEALAHGCADE
jgi:hypothetical protein